MDRPLSHTENEEFLRRLRERRIGLEVDSPKIEVRFDELSVEANVHMGLRALPTLFNSAVNAVQEFMGFLRLYPTKKTPIKILDQVKGIIKPSRMTLLLGPPGSGKSTLLRALAGKLDPNLKLKGKVTYNGQEIRASTPHRICAYVSQYDVHHAEMTVRETLDFSRRMFGTGKNFDMPGKGRKNADRNKVDSGIDDLLKGVTKDDMDNFTTNYFIKLLGLQECANITIGDEMRRGISGGQKKRVTIGEMLVGLTRSYFMDDISTGLDSSTTFEIIKFLKQMTQLMDLTMAISLLQPPAETFELFDDIILLSEGQVVYQGPRENVLEFFESIGFECPGRKNIADFLQEVISKMDQEQYWGSNQQEYEYFPVEKFVKYFQNSHLGQLLENELHKPHDSTSHNALIQYGSGSISKWEVFKACFSREILLVKRNLLVHAVKTIQIVILAFVIMTLFLRTNMNHHSIADGNKFLGAIFAGVIIVKFNGMAELSMAMKRLPVYYKQRELLFLPGWVLLSSIFILSLPTSLVETGIWTCLTYFAIGFAPSAIRFFQQFIAFFCIHQMSMGLFRFIAVVGRTQIMANMIAIATLIAIYILGDFVISKDNIQPWLVWGFWASPLTYGQNAVALNEFLDKRWTTAIRYEHVEADTLGKAILRSRGLFTKQHWFWTCIAALVGFSLLFNILTIFALEYLNFPNKHQVIIDSEATDVKKRDKIEKQMTRRKPPSCGVLLPFQPLTLAFCHINYYVDMPIEMKKHGVSEEKLQLLQDVSGVFRPGVLTALMGVTGAGKTTMLDVLAGRKTGGYIEGTITVSGYPKKQEAFARISGYCEQNDIHSPFLTIYESLQYSAWLRLPSDVETQKKNMFVEEVMGLVELTSLANAMVGLPGISGLYAEQRKRLTIAVELVSSPSIIFMDEPTTGLDARAAAIVMRTVRKTVDTGRTVVCTIHQPSTEIFEAFDEALSALSRNVLTIFAFMTLLLMKRGGMLIYGGPLGPLSMNMIQYFEAIPGIPKVRTGQNPAAWMLDITSSVSEYNMCVDYADIFRNSYLYKGNTKLVDEMSKPQPNSTELQFTSRYAESFKAQFAVCLWKQNRSYWKCPQHNLVRFIVTVGVSLIFGAVFWQTGSRITSEQDVFNILGVIYSSALFIGFANASSVQPVVGMERTVLYRERSAGMYSSLPYALSQVVVEIPYIILQVLIFSVIVYPMIGFPYAASKFVWFLVFILLSFFYFTLFGMMTAAVTPTQELAALLSFLIYVLWNIFSGFIIPIKMIPVWWRWLYWANPAAWTVYGLMFSQLGNRVEIIHVPGSPDQTVREFLEDYLGLEEKYFSLIVALHIVAIFVFLFIFCFSIEFLNFQKR